MRTDGAWIYFCKECKSYHLVKYETLKQETKNEYEVYILCPYAEYKNGVVYDGREFKPYLGYASTVQSNLVEVDYLRKKEAQVRKRKQN